MKILHISPTFYPASYWGGPIWSTKAICDGIARMPGVKLRVLTSDAAGPAISDRVVPADLPYPVTYTKRWAGHCISPAFLARLPGAIARADVVHLTGTYNMPTLPTFLLARTFGKPLVWSPRGALLATQDWAGAPNQRAKHMFEHLAARLRPRNMVLHVTAPQEASGSIARLPGLATVTIPNAVDIPARADHHAGSGCRLMCLGRLHPKKGLEQLFAAMTKLPQTYSLDIYGTGDADYRARLSQLAEGTGGRIRLHGHVEGADKAAAFANADLFVLPSHSENFGLVVAEALAHAVPVLTTTATPWQGLDAQGAGACIDLQHDDLAAQIERLAGQDLRAMGARGRAWIQRDFSMGRMVGAFAELYSRMSEAKGGVVRA